MTRQHNQQIHCVSCGAITTTETAFGRWIRNNTELDSIKDAIVVQDQDYWIHKYTDNGTKSFQLLCGVEIKTMGGKMSNSQKDVVHIINQLMRNRKQTPTKDVKWQAGSGINVVKSLMSKCEVRLKSYGMHVLTFSGLGPDDSDLILWDKNRIDVETLTKILRFDLDPDTLKPIDLKPHHMTHASKVMRLF